MGKYLYIMALVFVLGACSSPTQQREGSQGMEPTLQSEPSDSQPAMNPDIERDSSILFFGNSLTAGYLLEINQAFPALIQQKMDSLGLPYEAVNSGLSGETSSGGRSRLKFQLETLKKPLAVLRVGIGGE